MQGHTNTRCPAVVKIGGSTLGSHDTSLDDLATLQKRGVVPVVVHGGGKVISQWMERQGGMPRFVRGLRVTDASGLEVVTAVLGGLINKQLVAALAAKGTKAIGLSGVDGAILQARIADPELGLVGEVTQVDVAPLLSLVQAGYIPLVAPLGIHPWDGSSNAGQLLNINGDAAAGAIAAALGAERLVFLTDVEGVLDSSGRLFAHLAKRQVGDLIESGTAKGGMIPKLEACLHALGQVKTAHIVDGRKPGALLDCMDGKSIGTRIE